MGLFLNTLSPAMLYEEIAGSTYFVDKTEFIGRVAERVRAALARQSWRICWEPFPLKLGTAEGFLLL